MLVDQREQQRKRLLSNEGVRRLIGGRAYQFYLERGREHGKDREDWIRAEREVISFLQELIQGEIQLQKSTKTVSGKQSVPAASRRSSKKVSLPTDTKKSSLATPKPARKAAPKETSP